MICVLRAAVTDNFLALYILIGEWQLASVFDSKYLPPLAFQYIILMVVENHICISNQTIIAIPAHFFHVCVGIHWNRVV
jgi:hypothetical protein